MGTMKFQKQIKIPFSSIILIFLASVFMKWTNVSSKLTDSSLHQLNEKQERPVAMIFSNHPVGYQHLHLHRVDAEFPRSKIIQIREKRSLLKKLWNKKHHREQHYHQNQHYYNNPSYHGPGYHGGHAPNGHYYNNNHHVPHSNSHANAQAVSADIEFGDFYGKFTGASASSGSGHGHHIYHR